MITWWTGSVTDRRWIAAQKEPLLKWGIHKAFTLKTGEFVKITKKLICTNSTEISTFCFETIATSPSQQQTLFHFWWKLPQSGSIFNYGLMSAYICRIVSPRGRSRKWGRPSTHLQKVRPIQTLPTVHYYRCPWKSGKANLQKLIECRLVLG